MTPSPLRVAAAADDEAAAADDDDGRTETPKEDEDFDDFLDEDDLGDRATDPRYLANVPLRGLPPGSNRAGARRRRDMGGEGGVIGSDGRTGGNENRRGAGGKTLR